MSISGVDVDEKVLADILKVSICKTDLDLNICEANSHLCSTFGYTDRDFSTGMSLLQLFDISQIDRFQNKVTEIRGGHKTGTECFIARRRDGSSLACEFQLTPFYKGTEIIGFEGIFSDITEQINRQQFSIIKFGKEWFNFLYKNMPGGVFLLNDRWEIKDINDYAGEILGYQRSELLEEPFEQLSPGFAELVGIEAVRGRINNLEHSFISKFGSEVPVLTSFREFVIAGETLYLLNFQDISSIIELQKAMLASEIKYRTLVETAQEGIAIIDLEDNITFCNNAFARMLGFKHDYLTGYSLSRIMDDVEFHRYKRLTREKSRGGTGRYETILIDKNKKRRHVLVSAAPFYEPGGVFKGIFGVVHDITEIKEKEILLKRQKADLKRLSNRLIEIQENERNCLARELHDVIGQKLGLAKMRLSKLMMEAGDAERQIVDEISELISELAADIRHLSSELRPKILDDMGLIPTIEWYLEKYCQVCHIKCHLTVTGEKYQLNKVQDINIFRVFQEVMLNIQKHSSATRAEIAIDYAPELLSIRVSDNGRGFNPECVGNGQVLRSGLGLLNIRERIDMIGGRTEIISRPGVGTTVTIALPTR